MGLDPLGVSSVQYMYSLLNSLPDLDHPEDDHLAIVEDAKFLIYRIHRVPGGALEHKAADKHEAAVLSRAVL